MTFFPLDVFYAHKNTVFFVFVCLYVLLCLINFGTQFRSIFRNLSNIHDGDFCKNSEQLFVLYIYKRSNINEVIRAVLNLLFIYFFTKSFYTHKKHKKHKNANVRISDFFRLRCLLCA